MIAPVCRQPVEGWFDEHLSIGVHQAVFVAHGEDNVVAPHIMHTIHGQVAYDLARICGAKIVAFSETTKFWSNEYIGCFYNAATFFR